nr:FG-GAP repeat protein [Haladaptatus sp. W1]
MVGAPGDDDNGEHSGSAYVFRFDGCQWTEEQKLTASDGTAYDIFGVSVAISDGVALIGASDDYDNRNRSGSVYVFQFDGSQWTEEQKLTPYDGTAYDGFGHRVAISADVALIGAYADDDNGKNSGAAYVFRFDGCQWVEEQKLTASDGVAYDKFGVSVAVSADVALIGEYGSDKGDTLGSAYVFRFDGSQWVEVQNLTASDGTAGDKFAHTMALSDNTALIGAYGDDDSGTDSGSAYVFRFDGSQWTEEQKLTSSEEIANDWFGYSVAMSDEVALIGAFRDHDNGNNSGAAYVFNL